MFFITGSPTRHYGTVEREGCMGYTKTKHWLFIFFIALLISSSIAIFSYFKPRIYCFVSDDLLQNMNIQKDDVVLFAESFESHSFLIIEEPSLRLHQYSTKKYSILPPFYDIPKGISTEIQQYIEKRNEYLQRFADKYLYINEENEEALHPPFDQCRDIDEILPFTYKNIDTAFVVSEEMAMVNPDMEVLEMSHGSRFQWGVVASVQFTDRFWNRYAHAGATGGYVYYDVVDQHYFTDKTTYFLGGNYDYDLDPLSIMKIVNVNSDPTMKYFFKSPNRQLSFLMLGVFAISICASIFSLVAVVFLLLQLLYYVLIQSLQAKKEKKGNGK
jgi:hypothetical protein